MSPPAMTSIVSDDNSSALPSLQDLSGASWTPLFKQDCSFPPEIFRTVLLNLIKNPNINTNRLFRADIFLDVSYDANTAEYQTEIPPRLTHFTNFQLKTIMVRKMIPRNPVVDKPLDQTCLFHECNDEQGNANSLVTYLPHISSADESPFYHPAVHGIGFLHQFNTNSKEGSISIFYSFFPAEPRSPKLERTAQHLLAVIYKHGTGCAAGYSKRVQHDVIIPQIRAQNTYSRLKIKYGRSLCETWVEATDPTKHVFEDLAIAAFLIELWADLYKERSFPGFVDIGCGNGLLVHILVEEGYSGRGFDARRRKSWSSWSQKAQENLKEMVLIPSILRKAPNTDDTSQVLGSDAHTEIGIHDGQFPKGTFIISNHADELTPWTPILANMSESPFMMIPCCSHRLNGSRFRAPQPKGAPASTSQYAALVVWISKISEDCGWVVEKEMLRIPSTRNAAVIGRSRKIAFGDVEVEDVVTNYGGAAGWEENSLKLLKGATRGH
ncbi:hypothetical protein HYFRA_00005942 [Hymenoscyphus fraxineus]|uniref:tRNA (uracil-O(2)-)-methyltransferase n=1 Tax=Hymenoscyphus fraxineus TaxID=746836 RepID=A0A9N9PIE3_9HELO|nr:hypothetical protein HYFRA_00005942 [Hymenoscyphus fraxineus]